MDKDPQQVNYEWKRRTDGPPWEVIDWKGVTHTFDTEAEGLDFIERDKRMLANASRAAFEDVTDQITKAFQDGLGVESGGAEQAAGTAGEAPQDGAPVGRQGNRRSRRRAARTSNRKKASGRRR